MDTSNNVRLQLQQQQARKSNQNIQVYVRVRPLNARKRCIRSAEVVDVLNPREILTRHTLDSKLTKKFTFDRSFGPESKQCDVYAVVVSPLIEEVLSGYNCTVFAYGQTGTEQNRTEIRLKLAQGELLVVAHPIPGSDAAWRLLLQIVLHAILELIAGTAYLFIGVPSPFDGAMKLLRFIGGQICHGQDFVRLRRERLLRFHVRGHQLLLVVD
ncbi:kinesin-like protein Klp61F, partial [Drosophila miranda]|uniref:kinesin-like protein Klp61F n=2 Tax=Drosophila miranda TaxID=7229 RepID=UPI00143F27BA